MVLEYESGRIAAKLERSQRILVQDVSFSLDSGEILALIGETGSGKTMTALSLMRLLPDNVTQDGESIRFLGRALPPREKMAAVLGVHMVYIPQNGLEFLNPSRTVRYHLYDSLEKLGVPKKAREKIALEKLRSVGFTAPAAILDKYPFQLSGGMAQRVTIALAACSKAKLVIADEPTNGLDDAAKARFLEMLAELFLEAAKLIITHDIAVARLCRRTLVLCGGRMMEKGPSDLILKTPRHPYTRALMNALVENGMRETPVLREPSEECPFFRRCTRAKPGCFPEHQSAEDLEWWCSESR